MRRQQAFFASIILTLILVSSMTLYENSVHIPVSHSNLYLVPSNATSVAMINDSIGRVFIYAGGSVVGAIIPVPLPDLLLNRDHTLQKLNLSKVEFNDYGFAYGVQIYQVSGIKLQNSTNGLFGYLSTISSSLNISLSNYTSLYVTDTIGNSIVLGNLAGVAAALDQYHSGKISQILELINLSSNDSVHLHYSESQYFSEININSSGNKTILSFDFLTTQLLYEFQIEYIYLVSSGKLQPLRISYAGTTATMVLNMNFSDFVHFLNRLLQEFAR